MTGTAQGAPAAALLPVQLVACALGSESIRYTPGVTWDEQAHHVAVEGQYGGCVSPTRPALKSASTAFEFTTTASCQNLLDTVPDERTIRWNTGQTSDLSGTATVNGADGLLLVTIAGTVTAGLFQGATYQLQIAQPAVESLALACFEGGIETTGGPAVLTITGI